jgi:hypothetical protein
MLIFGGFFVTIIPMGHFQNSTEYQEFFDIELFQTCGRNGY